MEGTTSPLLKYLSAVHHAKVRTCGIADNLRRTSVPPQLIAGATPCSGTYQILTPVAVQR